MAIPWFLVKQYSERKKLGKKNICRIKFLKSFRLNKSFYNVSDFETRDLNVSYSELTFNNSSNLELNFLKRVRSRINLFTTRRNLSRNIYNASDFERKFFVENQNFSKILLSRNSKESLIVWAFVFFKGNVHPNFEKLSITTKTNR